MKNVLILTVVFLLRNAAYSQKLYKFDSTASVNGCSNIYLQKISKDLQYELMVKINQIDSIPKFRNFDLSKYSKFITIYLSRYPIGNQYIMGICDDLVDPNRVEKTDKYIAQKGTILISKWNGRTYISVILTNIVLKNRSNKKIKLPSEIFDQMAVGVNGG